MLECVESKFPYPSKKKVCNDGNHQGRMGGRHRDDPPLQIPCSPGGGPGQREYRLCKIHRRTARAIHSAQPQEARSLLQRRLQYLHRARPLVHRELQGNGGGGAGAADGGGVPTLPRERDARSGRERPVRRLCGREDAVLAALPRTLLDLSGRGRVGRGKHVQHQSGRDQPGRDCRTRGNGRILARTVSSGRLQPHKAPQRRPRAPARAHLRLQHARRHRPCDRGHRARAHARAREYPR